jgi:hypothetical protein
VRTCFKGSWIPIDTGASCKPSEQTIDFYSKSGADATFLGINGKAADSDKLDGQNSTDFLGAGAKAADSDKLDGIDSTGFLGATATAANSDKLDGIDSSYFVQGQGFRTSFRLHHDQAPAVYTLAGLLYLGCGTNGTYFLTFQLWPNDVARAVWIDQGGTVTQTNLEPTGPDAIHVLPLGSSGNRHVVIRSLGGGWTGQWDMMFSGDGATDTCSISVLEDLSKNEFEVASP